MNADLISFLEEEALKLEKDRKKARRLYYLYAPLNFLLFASSIVFLGLIISSLFVPLLWMPLIISLVLFVGLSFIIDDPLGKFRAKVYNEVFPRVFKRVNETFEYTASGFNRSLLEESGFLDKYFFSKSISIYGEDNIKGKMGGVEVEFFEVRFYKEFIRYWLTFGGCILTLVSIPVLIFLAIFKGMAFDEVPFFGIIKKTKKYLSGLFMYADFHKSFNGSILMIPKENDRSIYRFKENFNSSLYTEISVENPYINDHYNIYTTDVQLGYYVLSQALIDNFYNIAREENSLPIVSFKNGKMFLLIPWEKDYFEVKNTRKKISGADYFLKHIQEINSFEKIVKDLNLNTRIWSKI